MVNAQNVSQFFPLSQRTINFQIKFKFKKKKKH